MNERVLLVEPAVNLARLVKRELTEAGMEVVFAPDVGTARRLLETHTTGLVLIETSLLSSGGLDLVSGIRSSPVHSGLPVIILGSQESSDGNVRWLEAGADTIIPRPVSAPVLVARLRALLRRVEHNKTPQPGRSEKQPKKRV
jgi:DNA-binding response OmpR family regulator